MAKPSIADLLEQADQMLADLGPAVHERLDAEQDELNASVDRLRAQGQQVDSIDIDRSDATRVDAARHHLATVRMHVAELRHQS